MTIFTDFADAEMALDKACGKLVRLKLGKLEEANAYRDAYREARAIADKHPDDFKAAERAERLEIAEAKASWAFSIIGNAADAAAEAAITLYTHGAAKAADTLEGRISEITARSANLAAIFADDDLEGDATGIAALEGQTVGLAIAAGILGKAAQAIRDAAEAAKADTGLD